MLSVRDGSSTDDDTRHSVMEIFEDARNSIVTDESQDILHVYRGSVENSDTHIKHSNSNNSSTIESMGLENGDEVGCVQGVVLDEVEDAAFYEVIDPITGNKVNPPPFTMALHIIDTQSTLSNTLIQDDQITLRMLALYFPQLLHVCTTHDGGHQIMNIFYLKC